ncbi:MAG: pyrimidine/purine nucleoside phosphorylase [Synergistaceae bacterium]|nr:pyrimidine/purine nucleoside phosphorylase [Synergistaceae bacterium]
MGDAREFENVKFVAKANVYFGGKVLSFTFFTKDGARRTAGVIFPGEYEFGTGDAEIMEVTSGELSALLPGHGEWEEFPAGGSFDVPANSKFKCRSETISEYVCSYVKA